MLSVSTFYNTAAPVTLERARTQDTRAPTKISRIEMRVLVLIPLQTHHPHKYGVEGSQCSSTHELHGYASLSMKLQ